MVLQHVQQLRVVDLQQHASDLACQLGIHALNQREQAFAEHLLLVLRSGSSQHGCGQRFLALNDEGLLHSTSGSSTDVVRKIALLT